MTQKLSRFGYITLKAQCDSLLANKGDEINAHEFHYSDSTVNGNSFIAEKPTSGKQWGCINASEFLHAGYPHIHLWGNINFAKRFIEQCDSFNKKILQ
jgi:cobyrinic acid a,c-diamide synthase